MLSADLAGDQGRYLYERKLAGRRLAVEQPSDPEHLAAAIDLLRGAGDATNVGHLAHRLLHISAFDALARLWNDPTHAGTWQRPGETATAKLLAAQLFVVEQTEVDRFASFIAEAIRTRQGIPGLMRDIVLDLAITAIGAASTDTGLVLYDAVVDEVGQHQPIERARQLARATWVLSNHQVRQRAATIITHLATAHARSDRRSLAISLSNAGITEGTQALHQLAGEGDLDAIGELLAHGASAPPNTTTVALDAIAAAIARAQTLMRPGSASDLAIATSCADAAGDSALWSALGDALTNPALASDEKGEILSSMYRYGTAPDSIRHHIAANVDAICTTGAEWDSTSELATATALRVMAQLVSDETTDVDLAATRLLESDAALDRIFGMFTLVSDAHRSGEATRAALKLRDIVTDDYQRAAELAARLIADLIAQESSACEQFLALLSSYPARPTRLTFSRLGALAASDPTSAIAFDHVAQALAGNPDPQLARTLTAAEHERAHANTRPRPPAS